MAGTFTKFTRYSDGEVTGFRQGSLFNDLKPVVVKPITVVRTLGYDPTFEAAEEAAYMVRLVDEIYKTYQISAHPTVFRNRSGSLHQYRNAKSQLVFGYDSVKRALKGFTDYVSIDRVWNAARKLYGTQDGHTLYGKLDGRKGAWALALHEAAHAVQRLTPGGIEYGSVHNACFVKALSELIEMFPYGNEFSQ